MPRPVSTVRPGRRNVRFLALALFALVAPVALAALIASLLTATPASSAGFRNYAFAVVGDTPYSVEQLERFPALRTEIDRRKRIEFAVHLGDIKPGGAPCTDDYFDVIKDNFDLFKKPLFFTPGDNEWTDCHRTTAGKFDPLERLASLRNRFFADPSQSLGRNPLTSESQGLSTGGAEVENQLWTQPGVVFASIHLVGSKNGLEPWFTDDATDNLVDDPQRREAEVGSRTSAALAWLDHTFDVAEAQNARGVAIFQHANIFNLGTGAARVEHQAFSDRLAERASAFNKPVLLLEGDTHLYLVDRPYLGTTPKARKLRRVIVQGSTSDEFLRVTVNFSRKNLFTFKRLPVP